MSCCRCEPRPGDPQKKGGQITYDGTDRCWYCGDPLQVMKIHLFDTENNYVSTIQMMHSLIGDRVTLPVIPPVPGVDNPQGIVLAYRTFYLRPVRLYGGHTMMIGVERKNEPQ